MRIKYRGKYYKTTKDFHRFVVKFSIVSFTSAALLVAGISHGESDGVEEVQHNKDISYVYNKPEYTEYIKETIEIKEIEEEIEIKKRIVEMPEKKQEISSFDLRNPSGITEVQAESILMNTELSGLGGAFVQAEEEFGVNALYLIAHAALESGWGTSPLSQNKNNLFGIAAYDHDPYNSASTFDSKEDCILWLAKFVAKEYLDENGKYYNGSNLKGMNIKYASDKNWANKISAVIVTAQKRMSKHNLVAFNE